MKNICEEKIEAQIKSAIARSEAHDQIVAIAIDGDSGDAFAAIRQLTDCDTGFAMFDREGEDRLDVWGFEEDANILWRLNIRFTGNI